MLHAIQTPRQFKRYRLSCSKKGGMVYTALFLPFGFGWATLSHSPLKALISQLVSPKLFC